MFIFQETATHEQAKAHQRRTIKINQSIIEPKKLSGNALARETEKFDKWMDKKPNLSMKNKIEMELFFKNSLEAGLETPKNLWLSAKKLTDVENDPFYRGHTKSVQGLYGFDAPKLEKISLLVRKAENDQAFAESIKEFEGKHGRGKMAKTPKECVTSARYVFTTLNTGLKPMYVGFSTEKKPQAELLHWENLYKKLYKLAEETFGDQKKAIFDMISDPKNNPAGILN